MGGPGLVVDLGPFASCRDGVEARTSDCLGTGLVGSVSRDEDAGVAPVETVRPGALSSIATVGPACTPLLEVVRQR